MQRYVVSRVCQVVRRIVALVQFCTVTSLALSSEFATATPSRQVERGSEFRAVRLMFRSFHSRMSDNMERELGDSYVCRTRRWTEWRGARSAACFKSSVIGALLVIGHLWAGICIVSQDLTRAVERFCMSAWPHSSMMWTEMKNTEANKSAAGKGGFAVLLRSEHTCPALPDRERWATWTRTLRQPRRLRRSTIAAAMARHSGAQVLLALAWSRWVRPLLSTPLN